MSTGEDFGLDLLGLVMSIHNSTHVTREISGSNGARALPVGHSDGDADQSAEPSHLIIIDHRALDRECLARSIRSQGVEWDVVTFGSIQEWKSKRDRKATTSAILLSLGGRKFSETSMADEIRSLSAEFTNVPVVVLAESDNLTQILKALELGARSYIPTSVGIEVCVEAIRLAIAGGTFVPVNSVRTLRQALESGEGTVNPVAGIFTARQAEVADALRRGKANKIIAYELNLRESTVKVHVRNIMKKLKATNRTEVAFKISDLFAEGYSPQ